MPASRMPRLWAPWRMEYVAGASTSGRKKSGAARAGRASSKAVPSKARARRALEKSCLFCRVGAARSDRQNLVLVRGTHAFAMLNRYPYNAGHLMVAGYRHAGTFAELKPEEAAEVVALIALAERALGAEYRPSGMNYGANTGRSAGAGVLGHLHVHLVPRWDGDTNFMPVIGETKVLPESLDRTWARLTKAFAAAGPKSRGGRRGR